MRWSDLALALAVAAACLIVWNGLATAIGLWTANTLDMSIPASATLVLVLAAPAPAVAAWAATRLAVRRHVTAAVAWRTGVGATAGLLLLLTVLSLPTTPGARPLAVAATTLIGLALAAAGGLLAVRRRARPTSESRR